MGEGVLLVYTLTSLLCPAAVRCPVSRAVLASPAPAPILATMEVSSRPARAPAAAPLGGWYEGCGLCVWGGSPRRIPWWFSPGPLRACV